MEETIELFKTNPKGHRIVAVSTATLQAVNAAIPHVPGAPVPHAVSMRIDDELPLGEYKVIE